MKFSNYEHDKLYFKSSFVLEAPEYLGSSWTAKSKWKIGKCSDCGVKGIFWDGGKKDFHLCVKCNLRIKK